jgi:hypothetical protein
MKKSLKQLPHFMQVLINCGAVVDVRNVLGLSFDQNIRCFIVDSHRPVHLANLHGMWVSFVFL